MRLRRELNRNRIARTHLATGEHHPHHTGLPNEIAPLVAIQHRSEQPVLELVQLSAGIPKPGDLHDGRVGQPEPGAGGQSKQVEPARSHVLAHITSRNREAARTKLVMKLRMDEVHLTQIGLAGIARDPRAVLDGAPQMGIALNAKPGDQPDALTRGLAEGMLRSTAHRRNDRAHGEDPRAGADCCRGPA